MVLFVCNLLMNGIYILKCSHLSLLKIRVINLVKICNIIVQRSLLRLQSATVQKTYIPLNGNKKHVYKYNSSFLNHPISSFVFNKNSFFTMDENSSRTTTSSNNRSNRSQVYCFCGVEAIQRTSRTTKNPGRRFYNCASQVSEIAN